MDLPVRTVAIITLTLIIVAGLSVILYTYTGDATSEVEDTSKRSGEGLGCVTDSPHDTEECKKNLKGESTEDSSLEVREVLDETFTA